MIIYAFIAGYLISANTIFTSAIWNGKKIVVSPGYYTISANLVRT